MKIGITTWSFKDNPGTFLQVYGLYTYLEKKGHEVYIIRYDLKDKQDMIPRGIGYYISNMYGLTRKKILSHLESRRMQSYNTLYKCQLEERARKCSDAWKYFHFTDICSYENDFKKLNDDFDLFIVGSDQIWNPVMLNKRYFLDYVTNNKLKVSYATSTGTSHISTSAKHYFKEYLNSFSYLSVREESTQQALQTLTNIPVEHVLDPSMLLSKEDYKKIAVFPKDAGVEKGKYLLCYFMPRNKKQREQIHSFSKNHNLKVLIIGITSYTYIPDDGATLYIPYDPYEFVGLIYNAAAVFTSSFHCTIFSVLFNKDLYVFQQPPTTKAFDINGRFIEQLKTYKMLHRYINWQKDITDDNMKAIDYDTVNEIFEKRLKISKDYLNQFV